MLDYMQCIPLCHVNTWRWVPMVISVRGSLGEAYIVHVLNVFWNLEVTDLHGGFYPYGSFERSKAFSCLQQPYKKWSAFRCFCAAVSESGKMRRWRGGASTVCPWYWAKTRRCKVPVNMEPMWFGAHGHQVGDEECIASGLGYWSDLGIVGSHICDLFVVTIGLFWPNHINLTCPFYFYWFDIYVVFNSMIGEDPKKWLTGLARIG